ncbi:MAG: hypothetical protein NUW24_01380 [Anaerolineae bacterium]|nr:hypothetical protein [Anaerolineae bacterium]MDH7475110.1 hypothetical protein [Anaerolineae bacterium]
MQFPFAVEKLRNELRLSLPLWPLGLIAVLIAVLVWSNGGPVIASAFQSPPSPLGDLIPTPESLLTITTPVSTTPVGPPVQEPVTPHPAARLFLWIGIGLLIVSAITGTMLIWQRRKG